MLCDCRFLSDAPEVVVQDMDYFSSTAYCNTLNIGPVPTAPKNAPSYSTRELRKTDSILSADTVDQMRGADLERLKGICGGKADKDCS